MTDRRIDDLPAARIHKMLWRIAKQLPSDFEPWGKRPDSERGADCSCGCKWFLPCEKVGADWGVCANPKSPRAGLLTFEHMGCKEFDPGIEDE